MSELVPHLTEIAAFRRSVTRRMWVIVALLGLTTLGALLLALLAFTRPVPVVAFDAEGKPLLFADTATPRMALSQVRVEHFAQAFLERYVALDSATIDRDYAAALNMMTPDLRTIMIADADEARRRSSIAVGNLRGELIGLRLEIADFDPDDVDGRVYVVAVGQLRMRPRFGAVTDGPGEITRHVLTELALQRVPVSKPAIHGLLVDFVHTRFLEDPAAVEAESLRRTRGE